MVVVVSYLLSTVRDANSMRKQTQGILLVASNNILREFAADHSKSRLTAKILGQLGILGAEAAIY